MENHEFRCSKYLIDIKNVDIDKIMISNKVYFGEKDFKLFIFGSIIDNDLSFLSS